MNKIFLITTISTLLLTSTSIFANTTNNGCEIKKQKIETQIEYAKKYNNTHQIEGLQRALDNVNTYCTPESLYRDAKKKVAEKQEKVKEREAELLEEKQKNNSDKINKRERKLAEAQNELKAAQDELDTYKTNL